MRVIVLGAGGIGSVVAAQLTRAGHDVTLVARGDHLRAIAEHGLRVHGLDSFAAAVHAAESSDGDCDLLVVATKTPDTVAALDHVRDLRPASVLSLQNGVLKNEVLTAAFGRDRVVGATTMIGGQRDAPGSVAFTLDGVTVIGELGGTVSERVEDITAAWNASGLSMLAVPDIDGHEWAKQILQAAVSPLSVLTNLPIHLIWGTRHLAELLVRMMREGAAVATALGIEVTSYVGYGFDVHAVTTEPMDTAVERILERGRALVAAGKTDTVVSMLQDIRLGRRTEIEETAGHVVELGARHGVATPLLAFGCDVVRGVEHALGAR